MNNRRVQWAPHSEKIQRSRPRYSNGEQKEMEYVYNKTIEVSPNHKIEIGHYEKPEATRNRNISTTLVTPFGKGTMEARTRGNRFFEGRYHKTGKNAYYATKTYREDCHNWPEFAGHDRHKIEIRDFRSAINCFTTMIISLKERIEEDSYRERIDINHYQYNINFWYNCLDFYDEIDKYIQNHIKDNYNRRNYYDIFNSLMNKIIPEKNWKSWFIDELCKIKQKLPPYSCPESHVPLQSQRRKRALEFNRQ